MKKLLSVLLIVSMLAAVLSACGTPEAPTETTAPSVSIEETDPPVTEETEPATTAAPETVNSGRKPEAVRNSIWLNADSIGIEDDASSIQHKDNTAYFTYYDDRIQVLCQLDTSSYVSGVITHTDDKVLLAAISVMGSEGLHHCLKIMALPFLRLDNAMTADELVLQLISAPKIEQDNIVYRSTQIGQWMMTLVLPNSDDSISIMANFIPPEEDVPETTEPSSTEEVGGASEAFLDLSQVWSIQWNDADGFLVFSTDYLFDGKGNFQALKAMGMEYYDCGHGTYSFSGYNITLREERPDGIVEEVYKYHAVDDTLELISDPESAKGYELTLSVNLYVAPEDFKDLYDRLSSPDYDIDDDYDGYDIDDDYVAEPTEPAKTPETSAPKAPTECSHRFTDATCTTGSYCEYCGKQNSEALGHTFRDATCLAPETCTKCGMTRGSELLDHIWTYTSCTTPKICSRCSQELGGSEPGHQWKNATCTEPETCAVCKQTQGSPLGHHVSLTKCGFCDYTDYSAIAGTYSVAASYDGKTGEDLTASDVSISNSGVLSFTFNGNRYSITIKEQSYDSMTYFDCYQNGSKLSNIECRIGDASYDYALHLQWDGLDGHRLYFYALP